MIFGAYGGESFRGELSDLAASVPTLCGDFYSEPDDVVRGLTLPLGDGMDFGSNQELDGGKLIIREHWGASAHGSRGFQAMDVAPGLSEEVERHLEATVSRLDECSPILAGNRLLTFLEQVVDARVNKVSHKKFTIRAEIFAQGLYCDVKFRIYQRGRACVVEFQRRCGDGVAFSKLYQRASGYLQKIGDLQAVCPAVVDTECTVGLPELVALPPAQRLAPLLDMVASNQGLLAEVAAALAVMARDPGIAAELRMPCAFSAMQQLRQSSDFNVAFPASCSLRHI